MDPKKILLAIDDSDSALRAVDYVARLIGDSPGFQVTIIHVIEDPSEDYFETEEQRRHYLAGQEEETRALLGKTRATLEAAGLAPERIAYKAPVKTCDSMAACILSEQEDEGFGTLVVGRRGLSKAEEFLFGSISNRIIHYARNCTVWVVV
ncbi:MAG: universal stress protein [Proteobacteria bacterium]|nr:universal stress protein [Pseudomonadota bacterium]